MKYFKNTRILATSAAELLPRTTGAERLGASSKLALLVGLLAATAVPASATTYLWTGTSGTTNNWSDMTNWNGGAGPSPVADFTMPDLQFGFGKAVSNNDVANPFPYNSITFVRGALPMTLIGMFAAVDAGGITNNSAVTQVIAFTPLGGGVGGLLLTSSQTWNAASGNLVIATDVTFGGLGAEALTITGPYNTVITGSIYENSVPPFFSPLIKNGTGTLLLTGNSTFPGNTVINAGTVLVDGSTASLQTIVNPAGTLGGTGLVGGSVLNSGVVSPGNFPTDSSSTLRVGGNYTQTPGGTLAVNVANNQSNVLAVQGAANLNGNLRITQLGSAPRLNVGQQITFLTATGGVKGQFSSVSGLSSDTIVMPQVVYHQNSVAIEGEQGSFAAFALAEGLTPNERAVAGGLDHVAFHGRQPKLIGFLDSESLSRLPEDFDKISPDGLTSIFTIGVALANVQSMNLQRRNDDIRAGVSGFSAAGFHTAGSGPLYSGALGVAGPSGNDGKESKEMKAIAPVEDRWGTFITGVGEWVSVNGDGNGRDYDINTGGFTLGADYRFTPNFALGVSAGYAGTASDLNNGGRVYVNGAKFGIYSTYFTGGFYVDGAVNGGYNSYETRRAGLQGTARGSTDGGELNVLFGTGYDFKSGNWTIGPTATFQYSDIGISRFSESGSLAPLTFRSQSQDSLRTAFGVKTSYDWKVGGIVIKPEVRAAWQHEYGDDAYALDSSFSGGGGSLFTVNGPRTGRDSLLVGAGFAIMWNERTSTYVYYDGELARTRYDAQNVSAGIRVSF